MNGRDALLAAFDRLFDAAAKKLNLACTPEERAEAKEQFAARFEGALDVAKRVDVDGLPEAVVEAMEGAIQQLSPGTQSNGSASSGACASAAAAAAPPASTRRKLRITRKRLTSRPREGGDPVKRSSPTEALGDGVSPRRRGSNSLQSTPVRLRALLAE